jgi:hypothetical protein
MMAAWSLSASSGRAKVSTLRRMAANGSSPVQKKAPSHTPAKSATITSRKISASAIASSGGSSEIQAGR